MTISDIIQFSMIYVGVLILTFIFYKIDKRYVKKSERRTDVSEIQTGSESSNPERRELRKKGGQMEGETFYDW